MITPSGAMKHRIQEYVPLAPFTTFAIGGEARFFITAQSIDEVVEALAFAHERALPVFILGGGSNILVSDDGFSGVVVYVQIPGIVFTEHEGQVLAQVGAGVVWDEFVQETVARGYAGLECLSGIPGTVGGGVVANLGAYGAECSDTFIEAEVLDLRDLKGGVRVFKKADCDFSYHDSCFGKHSDRFIVLRATFAFAPSDTARPHYEDSRFNLAELTAKHGRPPTLAEVRDAVIAVRAAKGVLSTSYHSAGSFFHMPFVSLARYGEIEARARALDAVKEEQLRPWAWEQADGSYKLAPGFLLEYTPYKKGYVEGAVGISPKHTLSVITTGTGATAHAVAELAQAMHDAVEKIFGISLEREVTYVGAVENNSKKI